MEVDWSSSGNSEGRLESIIHSSFIVGHLKKLIQRSRSSSAVEVVVVVVVVVVVEEEELIVVVIVVVVVVL